MLEIRKLQTSIRKENPAFKPLPVQNARMTEEIRRIFEVVLAFADNVKIECKDDQDEA